MDRKSRFTAIKANDIVECKLQIPVPCKHLSPRSSWMTGSLLPVLVLVNNATPCALAQGRRHGFESGGTEYLRTKRATQFFGGRPNKLNKILLRRVAHFANFYYVIINLG